MNKPVAWINTRIEDDRPFLEWDKEDSVGYINIPLYTHPVKKQKCVVQDCENHKHEGSFNGDLCSPCYQFIAHGKGIYSQAYRNTHLTELTDEEIADIAGKTDIFDPKWIYEFARAILRKAQEK